MVLELFRYLSQFESYLRKTVNPEIAIFFSLTRPGGVKILPKEVNSGTIGLGTSQGFVWSLFHSSISIRGEMAWGVATPTCAFYTMGK